VMAKPCRSAGDGESLRQAFAISVLKWVFREVFYPLHTLRCIYRLFTQRKYTAHMQ
jgi:hypothetical protein